ncbi:MAG: transcription-repair coupling factor [Candidatus Endonucleobacter bathymodioli]|uniref:Transcription-repair-coupling factor n=1 Tax=Candidatus Endonucleibacter bathymodioli TaxID=539814 RepID=A0AA90NNG2_9GAMM|nr:transcription-repair coupling factor [Candidatus Endonucleobacter bathymodioli]
MEQARVRLPHKAGERFYWGNLSGTLASYAVYLAAQQSEGLLLVLTPDSAKALELEEELNFFLQDNNDVVTHQLPDWETLPYDRFSPHHDIIAARLTTLCKLPKASRSILIAPITTLIHKISPQSFLQSESFLLKKGETFSLEQRRKQFEQAGYRCVDTVYEHGEFTIRGAITDIYPMGSELPFRIDLFDDEIDSIRTFDPESQQSINQIDQIKLLPAHEFPMDQVSRDKFRANFRDAFNVDHRECPIYQDIGAGIASPGIEYFLPLFFDETATIFEYLPKNTCIMLDGNTQSSIEKFLGDAKERYENRKIDPLHPLLPPDQLFLHTEEFYHRVNKYPRIILSTTSFQEKQGRLNFTQKAIPDLTLSAKSETPLAPLKAFMAESERILFIAESPGRKEVLLTILKDHNITPKSYDSWQQFRQTQDKTGITIGALNDGFSIEEDNLTLIPESMLMGRRVMQQRRRKKTSSHHADQIIRNIAALRLGAPVVHVDHGVGRYRGLQALGEGSLKEEFLALEYADEAKLYVPVASLHLIARYNGSDDNHAPLHRLGSDQWRKARKKAAEKARDVAVELLDIYARRESMEGYSFTSPGQEYLTFTAAFPFEETPDQQQAIDSVIADMCSPAPMDRLICGDVGFGKTEVAMRAAFLALQDSKQVAILVPTTLLAQQHFNSFSDRFADWPVEVGVISRFRTSKEVQNSKERLKKGQLDIVIGTHKILQDQLELKDLGLLIIDEEHRFGVRHKEKLKSLRARIDILTLTATPIPRTLNMAMSGIRDLSIIATPPARRLSVKTFVLEKNKPLIREAILRELLRGGQVYYLHNEVHTIETTARELQELIPEARVAIGHGQLRERELERVMSDFYHKRFNVLVCTTIIETGIDIPNANTIILNRADKFGLAQLHQLRGRVGRSHHQAYAYLLTPTVKSMTADACKRLEAICDAQDLGSGFMLASNDLEIRGAGELLGEGQSGQIQSVGFSMYTEMLEKAVDAIRKGETPNLEQPLGHGLEINLRVQALLPDDYIHDIHSRLVLYKRIAASESEAKLRTLQVEMIDRFGLLPQPAKNLFTQAHIKLKAQALGVQKMDAGPTQVRFEFESQPKVDPMIIIQLIQSQSTSFKLEGNNILKYRGPMEADEERFKRIENVLDQLAGQKH